MTFPNLPRARFHLQKMELPLVAVARVVVGVELAQVQREMSRHVCPVDNRADTGLSSTATQLPDRKRHRGRGRVVAEEERTCSRPDSGPDRFDDLLRARDR